MQYLSRPLREEMALVRGGGMLTQCDRPGADPAAEVHSTHQKSAAVAGGEEVGRERRELNHEGGAACPPRTNKRQRRHAARKKTCCLEAAAAAALGFIPKMIGVGRIPRTRAEQLHSVGEELGGFPMYHLYLRRQELFGNRRFRR